MLCHRQQITGFTECSWNVHGMITECSRNHRLYFPNHAIHVLDRDGNMCLLFVADLFVFICFYLFLFVFVLSVCVLLNTAEYDGSS